MAFARTFGGTHEFELPKVKTSKRRVTKRKVSGGGIFDSVVNFFSSSPKKHHGSKRHGKSHHHGHHSGHHHGDHHGDHHGHHTRRRRRHSRKH
jgi:hypothetical protein